MVPKHLCVPTLILAMVRGKLRARYIADRLGVTEEQVLRWRDVFMIAGTIALADEVRGHAGAQYSPFSTCIPEDPTTTTTTTTTPHPGTGTGTDDPGGGTDECSIDPLGGFSSSSRRRERGRKAQQQRPRRRH